MKMLELFSGSGIMSKTFREHGHEVISIDNNSDFKPDICCDILMMKPEDINFKPDIIWASPPCTAFSVCTISKNWKNGKPISDKAKLGIQLLNKTIELIKIWRPKYFFIENPRGMMRKQNIIGHRITQTYCKWGMKYQKPTDIWTNSTWQGRKPCKAGDRCHEYQPRSYKRKVGADVLSLGVQGLNNAFERGKLPKALCEDIVTYCEGNIKQTTLEVRE